MKKLIYIIVAALGVSGCSGLTQIIKNREALSRPEALTVPDPAGVAPAVAAYRIVSQAAQKVYLEDVTRTPPTTVMLIDIGIAAANNNCRDWFDALSRAEIEYKFGRGNVAIVKAALTTALAAVHAGYGIITGLGILSTADEAFAQQFQASVLALADYDLQQKVWQVMTSRAVDLRATQYSYPQALEAIRSYGSLCLPSAASAIVKSTLNATQTTVSSTGAFLTSPILPPISSVYTKDEYASKIIAFWIPGNTINLANEKLILDWMSKNGINTSIPYFAHSKLYEAARKQLIIEHPEIDK